MDVTGRISGSGGRVAAEESFSAECKVILDKCQEMPYNVSMIKTYTSKALEAFATKEMAQNFPSRTTTAFAASCSR